MDEQVWPPGPRERKQVGEHWRRERFPEHTRKDELSLPLRRRLSGGGGMLVLNDLAQAHTGEPGRTGIQASGDHPLAAISARCPKNAMASGRESPCQGHHGKDMSVAPGGREQDAHDPPSRVSPQHTGPNSHTASKNSEPPARRYSRSQAEIKGERRRAAERERPGSPGRTTSTPEPRAIRRDQSWGLLDRPRRAPSGHQVGPA